MPDAVVWMTTVSETELLAQAKTGAVHAFEQALKPYLPMLFAYSRAICGDYHTAQDVVQETALIAFCNLGHLFAEADFATWLKAIARRQALAARRQQARLGLVADELLEQVFADLNLQADAPRHVALEQCLARLSGRMAQVIRAHYFEGLSLADIAAALRMSVTAVKQLLYRARLWLHCCMSRRLQDEGAK